MPRMVSVRRSCDQLGSLIGQRSCDQLRSLIGYWTSYNLLASSIKILNLLSLVH